MTTPQKTQRGVGQGGTDQSRLSFRHSLRLLLLGDSCVGKSSLMCRYAKGTFNPGFYTTIGIDYKYKFTQLRPPGASAPVSVRMEIWDTAGQERFHSISRSYIKGAQAVVVVYSVGDRRSFEHVESWLHQIAQYNKMGDKVPIVLVGNKCDLEAAQRTVATEECEALARRHGLLFYEASAKTGRNVEQLFEVCGGKVLEQLGHSQVGGGNARRQQKQRQRVVPDDNQRTAMGCWERFFGTLRGARAA